MFDIPENIPRCKVACCFNCVNKKKVTLHNPSDSNSEWMCALDWADITPDYCCEYHYPAKEDSVRAR